MDQNQIDQILANQLGKIGATGGAIGGAASGVNDSILQAAGFGGAGSAGGNAGAKWAAKFLKNDVKVISISLPLTPQQALEKAFGVLSNTGQLIDTSQSTQPTVAAIIGSGISNPAVIIVEVGGNDGTNTQLTITGIAKEGLIKQRTGEKTAIKIQNALLS